MDKILVIEDDRMVQKALRRLFESAGYCVDTRMDGVSGLESFRAMPPAAVVLDLRLPGRPGQEVCREIKQQSPALPIIVLSATTDVADKVLLLEQGADDYVTKPFSPRELLARVQAAIRRRRKPTSTGTYRFADCEVDFSKMTPVRKGAAVTLTSHEFRLLKFFTANAERVLSRDELLNEVWGYNCYPTTRTVDNQILKLRQKLEPDPANPAHFLTIYGAGYKFVP